ncbi:dynein associated protein-domain-containing protein [Lipomyces chichibuensis]|uniref:dynein associated protein-domain-containing protein n=1 Tax=Lipomyces chichibuensis TaxID=1546026 RepID=UPI003343BC2B
MSTNRDIEDLQSKLRILERKRADDRDRLLDLERLKQEREKLERIISRLEAKIKPMFDTQQELRTRVRELEAEKHEIGQVLKERTEQFEIITLDREVAEEQEERLRDELSSVKAQLEEALLETEILKEENADFKRGSETGERDANVFMHLEEQNERLKEALIRLRDQTAADEAESRAEVKRLQRDVETYAQLQSKYEIAISQLRQTEEIADNLRQQLDIAFGADQILDELTVKNLALSEQIEEMRIAIQDLETLKEINDEIEANHLEAAKQTREEIDYRDILLREQAGRMSQFEDTTADYEYTVERFRELVASLQSDLDQLRTEKSMSEAESAEISRRTREMYDLNQKLQASALKTQVKTIDLELRKLEAQEALEHLSIIRTYIPSSLATMREAIRTLLTFRRISFKSNLVVSILRDNLQSGSETFVTLALGTEICDQLICILALCSRFETGIAVCDVSEFENYGPLMEDISPVEGLLDKAINSLRNYELNESELLMSLQKSLKVLEDLGAAKLEEVCTGEMRTQECCGQLLCIQSYVDSAIIIAQSILMTVAGELGGDSDSTNRKGMTYEADLAHTFQSRGEALVLQAKSVKALTSKAQAIMEEWKSSLRTPTDDTEGILSAIRGNSSSSCRYLRNVYFSITLAFNKDVESYEQIGYSQIQEIMVKEVENTGDAGTFFASATVKSMMTMMRDLVAKITGPNGSSIYEKARSPWLVKVEQLREQDAVNKDARTKVVQLNEDIKQLAMQIRLKDKELEESAIKINVLDSRLQKSMNRLERFGEIEREMTERAASESLLETTVQSLRREMKELEHEADALRKLAAVNESASEDLKKFEGQVQEKISLEEIDTLNKQIAALQATVRYLQDQAGKPSNSSWTDTAVAFLRTNIDGRDRKTAVFGNKAANKVFDKMIDLALTSDLVFVERDSQQGWKPLRNKARYIAARQIEQYRNLAGYARTVSLSS